MSCERYVCNLSEELLQKAQAELNEPTDNDERLKAIDELRTCFQEKSGLDLIRSDDAFILRFLRVKKFDQDRAYQCLLNYHKQRKEWPELFTLVNNPASLSEMIESGAVYSLGQVAKDKTFVLVDFPGIVSFKKSSDILAYTAVAVLIVEQMLENEELQIRGLTFVEDLSFLSFPVAMKMATSSMTSSITSRTTALFQDAMPIRMKKMHISNEGVIVDIIWAIASKFMNAKMKSRIQFHGTDFKSLHEQISPEFLPKVFQGTAPEIDLKAYKEQLISSMGHGEDTEL